MFLSLISLISITGVACQTLQVSRLQPSGYPRLSSSHLVTLWLSDRDLSAGGVPGLCRQLQVVLMERRWLGASQRTDCGLAGYDRCQLLTDLTLQLSLDIRQCRLQQFRTYKLCLTPARTTCSKSFSVEKYQPNHTNKDLLSLTISVRETTPKYYSSGDPREKIKLFYEELSRFSEGEDGELGEVEMQAEEEKRRLHEIMQRMLETFLIILITVSTILCVCLLCLLKFC